jgi:chemotaxis protein MotA
MKSRYWLTGVMLGFIAIAMTVYEATNGGKGIGTFFHLEGIILVFGGTLTTVFTVYPLKLAVETFRTAFFVTGKSVVPTAVVVQDIVKFAVETGGDLRSMEGVVGSIKHPFFRDGIQLIVDRLEHEQIDFILKERMKQNKQDYDRVMMSIKNLAKYPPAFGMVGTLAGLVAMMKGLGSSVGAGNLGSAMAIGLTATFYGVAFANLLILPLADNIQYKNEMEMQNRRIIAKGVLLIKEGSSPLLIQEFLNAMLKFNERIDVLGVGGGAPQNNRKAA